MKIKDNKKINETEMNKIKDNKDNLDNKEEKEKNNQKAEEYVYSSYNNFLSYIKDGNHAFQKDIKNCKKIEVHSGNRDLLWFILLGILPYESSSNWNLIITEERSLYLKLKNELITKDISDFIKTKKIKDKYSLYFKFKDILPPIDYSLLDLIKVDVNRTFQKISLFRLDKIQIILTNVLYIFAKKNIEIGYKQGMSDLCAVFLFVLYKEQIIKPAFIKDNNTFLFYLFHSNNEFLEHDTYLMFSKFMLKGFINFFKYNDDIYKDSFLSQLDNEQKKNLSKKEILNSNDSELKKRIFLLYYNKFPYIDNNLYTFMFDKIDPEIFIFRWYLCIFTREFPINKVVHLWDLILLIDFIEKKKLLDDEEKNKKKKEDKINKNKNKINIINEEEIKDINLDKNYHFIDYIALSMILNIKNLVTKKKSSSELMVFLMKYPQDIDLKNICQKALDIYHKINPTIKI